ncbi:MAG: acetyl-CoA carboxylase carboxyltransferase subunit alpha [Candidatus Heritagella sp.]
MIKEILQMEEELVRQIDELKGDDRPSARLRRRQLENDRQELLATCKNLSAEEKVFLARHPKRPKIDEYIDALFTDFFEQKGDRASSDDTSILGGIAMYKGMPVTVIGHRKGNTLEENMAYNFGMPEPEGYRKALRMMEQAEKFGRPIITFIDTPGAYPGKEAEEHGQGEAIARNLMVMSGLHVPIIAVVTGEGSSGGALALGVANRVLMLEHAIYSVLSPEGFASILWKDSSRRAEACEVMKLTAQDLYRFHVIEEVIPEPMGGAQANREELFRSVDEALQKNLAELTRMSGNTLAQDRYDKFRKIGQP